MQEISYVDVKDSHLLDGTIVTEAKLEKRALQSSLPTR